MTDLEQRRRDLLAADRQLYDYIAARENAKALDSLGDTLSGRDKGAANLAWAEAARYTEAAERLADA